MIKLLNGYYATADQYQFILGKMRKDKSGKQVFTPNRYYSDLQYLIQDFYQICSREKVMSNEKLISLSQTMEELEQIKKNIEQLFMRTDISDVEVSEEIKGAL